MPGGSIFAAFHASQCGGALPPSAEALRIWAPALTGRFHRKSAKNGGTGAWSAGAQMPGGSIFAAFHVSQCGGALPASAEALRIWAPALTGRFHRKSAKIGGTGAWSAGAQMPGGSIFAAFHVSQCGGALPASAEALRIWAPALTGRFHRKSAKLCGLSSTLTEFPFLLPKTVENCKTQRLRRHRRDSSLYLHLELDENLMVSSMAHFTISLQEYIEQKCRTENRDVPSDE
jgi:hypothetical protein